MTVKKNRRRTKKWEGVKEEVKEVYIGGGGGEGKEARV